MKICHLSPWFPSVNPTTFESTQGTFEFRQVINMCKRGHRFKVITIKWAGQLDYEKVNENLEIYRLPYRFVFSRIRYPVPNINRLTSKILEVSREWKPDIIVYSHAIFLTTLPMIFLKNRVKIPTVVMTDVLPGINWTFGKRLIDMVGYAYTMTLCKLYFREADGVHFLTSGLYPYSRRLGIDPTKIFVVSRGVDTAKFRPDTNREKRYEFGLSENDIVVISVTRMDPVKGVEYLLKAAKEVVKSRPNVKFLLVGGGALMEEYKQMANPMSGNILFTGFRNDIPELLSMSDIFVLTSLSEGAANVIMEASSSGLPVISTRVGEVPNSVTDNETGLLIEPKDVNGLVLALKKLIDDPVLARRMGVQGRKKIELEYDWGVTCKKLEDAYMNVIEKYRSKYMTSD